MRIGMGIGIGTNWVGKGAIPTFVGHVSPRGAEACLCKGTILDSILLRGGREWEDNHARYLWTACL